MIDPVQYYHDVLTPDIATASWDVLLGGLRKHNLVFGDRPICSVLRPYFLSQTEYDTIQNGARGVVSAIQKAFTRIDPDDYEPLLGLSPNEANLARIPCGFSPVQTFARLDGFWTRDGRLGFVEFNAESPGGIAFGSTLDTIFRQMPSMRVFQERFLIQSEPSLRHSLHGLIAAYRSWGGTKEFPTIAIVDWKTAPTYAEFVICRELFRSRGYETEIVDPTELEFSDGQLKAGEFGIDLVYRRIVASDVAANLAQDHALVRAARSGAVCVASGFPAFALNSKAMFALISDPDASPFLDGFERQAVQSTVPWTRIVRDGNTLDPTGKRVDLLEYALANREWLVVKPSTEYGGVGVNLGWTLSDSEWHDALRSSLQRSSVLQQRVALQSEAFPVFQDGRLGLVDFLADIDPYVFNGETAKGAGTRLSRSQLLNVTAGGGSAAPVFIVEPKN